MAPKRSNDDANSTSQKNGSKEKATDESKSPVSTRHILVTSAGYSALALVELLMTDEAYENKFAQVSVVVDDIDSAVAKELKELGANLMIESELTVDALKDIDTMMILVSEGEHGLGDRVRGQMITLTGPIMTAGPELAEAASSALSTKLQFQSITDKEAMDLLSSDQGEAIDAAEKEYLMEYYALIKQGKTNYCATAGFEDITGQPPQELSDFFKAYSSEFKPKKRRTTRTSSKVNDIPEKSEAKEKEDAEMAEADVEA